MTKKMFDAVAQQILSELTQLQVPEGSRLPSEAALCEKYNCSRQTVRKALASLTQKGVLTSRQGSGTYVARSLAGKKSLEVAFLVPAIKYFIYPDILDGAESVFSREGIRLSIYQAPDALAERTVFQRFLQEPPDGIITTNTNVLTPLLDYYQAMRDMGIPMIITESTCMNFQDCSVITMDSFSAGLEAARLLAEAGRKNIVGLFPYGNFAHLARATGFQCGLDRCGVPMTSTSTLYFSLSDKRTAYQSSHGRDGIVESDYRIIARCLETADGIFCGDMIIALVLDLLNQMGKTPGKDVSLLSITNGPFLEYTSVPISALSHAKEKLGQTAAELMVRLLRGGENEHISLPFEFIDRGSI